METAPFVVLASGEGTTFEYLASQPFFNIKLLLSDQKSCGALDHAKKRGLPFKSISPKDYSSLRLWDEAFAKAIPEEAALLALAGFITKLGPFVLKKKKAINSHPALLPDFGGKGMYGLNVHRAVLKAKKKETGITIHYVNENYDEGAVIAQKKIPVLENDTPEGLQDRIKVQEKPFYKEVLYSLLIKNEQSPMN